MAFRQCLGLHRGVLSAPDWTGAYTHFYKSYNYEEYKKNRGKSRTFNISNDQIYFLRHKILALGSWLNEDFVCRVSEIPPLRTYMNNGPDEIASSARVQHK